jgi:hypothetical protein
VRVFGVTTEVVYVKTGGLERAGTVTGGLNRSMYALKESQSVQQTTECRYELNLQPKNKER